MTTWERLTPTGSGTHILTSAGDTIDSGIITNKQHLKFEIYAIADGSVNPSFRFNSDAGTNYTRRREHNGSSDGTNINENELNSNGASTNTYVSGDIINIATKEKFLIAEYVIQKTGAGQAPDRMSLTGKWANTSDAITRIQVYNVDNGDFDTGSTLTVWGADDQGTTAKDKTTITNVEDGTRYEEVDTRKIFHKRTQTGSGGGDLWVEKGNTFSASALRGFASGGSLSGSGASNIIDYVTIQTLGNAIDFGDLIDSREGTGACADATRCLDGHGNSIEYWTASTLGNAVDFGDLSVSRSPQGGGFADATRGCFAGGSNVIDYVTIQSLGNATDFGDLQGGYGQTSACADATRGLISGGWTGANVDSIDYVTIQTTGNAGDFGNLLTGRYALASTSDATRGLIAGGQSSANVIEYVTIQTTGNSVDFGDLTVGRHKHTAYADSTRGCFVGGANGGRSNIIDYVTIQTLGNAIDFGNLTRECEVTGGCSA